MPCGKIVNGKHYSIITDHLGTPIEAYNQEGKLIWEREQDLYGNSRQGFAKENFRCPFKYQGQYYDPEIELCYNRFRYYHPETGRYISQDPIGFLSGEPNFFAYVSDTNAWVDVLGLDYKARTNDGNLVDVYRGGNDFTLKENEFKPGNSQTKYPARGLSVNSDPNKVATFGGAHKIVSIPEELEIIHTGTEKNPTHFDIIPKNTNISEKDFQELLNKIEVTPHSSI